MLRPVTHYIELNTSIAKILYLNFFNRIFPWGKRRADFFRFMDYCLVDLMQRVIELYSKYSHHFTEIIELFTQSFDLFGFFFFIKLVIDKNYIVCRQVIKKVLSSL